MGFETRLNPNPTDGQGGYFAPPLWLIDQFATGKRPGRTLPNLIAEAGNAFPLPSGTQSLNIPVIKTPTGDTTAPQEPDSANSETDDVDGCQTSPVVTVSGTQDVALQLLEQSPPGAHLDWALFKDLTESYDADLNYQTLYGTGTNGQFTGIGTAVTSATIVTYTDASPTFSEMYPYIGQAMATVGDNRLMPPQAWLMRTARWAWIGTSEDNSQRPMSPPKHAPALEPDDAKSTPIGSMLGLPVYVTDSVSASLGSTSNQDEIFVCRPSDLMLFEGTPTTSVHLEVLSGTFRRG